MAAVVAVVVGSSRRGEGSCGQGGKSPSPFLPPARDCLVPEAREMETAKDRSPLCRRDTVEEEWRPGPLFPPPLIVHWGLPRPPPLRLWFPTPTGLRPHWFDSFASPCFHPSRPRPRPRCLRAFVVRVSP